jgi:anti-sigma factor RsiW
MSHPDEGLIHAWLDGELDAGESARVEALVASDPAWAAAVAEARGLIAASARIVGALDRVPANVIPQNAVPPRRGSRQWMLRAAAVVVLLGGSAIVLNRTAPATTEQAVPPAAQPRKPAPRVAANAPAVDLKSSIVKKELAIAKRDTVLHDKDVAAPATQLRANSVAGATVGVAGADVAGSERRATASDASSRAAAAPAPVAKGFVMEQKVTRLPISCFEQRVPAVHGDSASRVIRLDAAALADSIQLEKLTLRGDTLAAVHGPLIAVRVRCQAP